MPTAKKVHLLPRIEGPEKETRIVLILDNGRHWKCQEFHFEKMHLSNMQIRTKKAREQAKYYDGKRISIMIILMEHVMTFEFR